MESKYLFIKVLFLVFDVFLVLDVFFLLILIFLFCFIFIFIFFIIGILGFVLIRDGCFFMLRDEIFRLGLFIRVAVWGDDLSSFLISLFFLFRMVCFCLWILMDFIFSLVIRFFLECFLYSYVIFLLGKWYLMKRKIYRFKWIVCYFIY